MRRVLGRPGTNFEAIAGGEVVGVFEVEDDHTKGGSVTGLAGWADVANHWVKEEHRGQGIGSWLFRQGCTWLRLAGAGRLLSYAVDNNDLPGIEHYHARHGLRRINRTRRGWAQAASA